MKLNTSVAFSVLTALCFAGFVVADDMTGMNMTPATPTTHPATQPMSAVDLRNTICPVSGEKVGDSNLVEVYDGKIYHMCCPDCSKDFDKDPAKIEKAVAADPAKYGIK